MSEHNIKINCTRNTKLQGIYIFLEGGEKKDQTFSTEFIDHVYAHTNSHTKPYESNTEKERFWNFSTPK